MTEIERAGGNARPFVADVSSSAAVRKMFADFIAAFGTIDILINNAGIGRTRDTSEVIPTYQKTDEEWHKMLATHLDSTFYCTREALKVMIPKQSGRIINMGSVAGTTGLAFASDYCAAKGGIIAFTKTAALELAKYNITVNALAPGFTLTDMLAKVPENVQAQIKSRIPMGRFGLPEEVAKAVLFLAADADYVTGQQINVNGGVYM